MSRRLASEAVGTAFLLAAVVGSGIMGERLAGGSVAIALLAISGVGVPLRLLSDECAFEFEQQHLPPHAWPPTTWFESWARGSNLFDLP